MLCFVSIAKYLHNDFDLPKDFARTHENFVKKHTATTIKRCFVPTEKYCRLIITLINLEI